MTGQPSALPSLEYRALWEALERASPVALYRAEIDGSCSYVNQRWSELTGLDRSDALGAGWIASLHPDDRRRIAESWQQAVDQQKPWSQEYRFQRRDGAVVWVYDQSFPFFDSAGDLAGYVGSITDITERKLADQEMRASEARFRALAAATSSAIWSIDASGELIDSATARWPYLTDLPQEDLAREWLAAVHPDDREPGNAVWWQGIAAGQPFEFEQRVRQVDGSYRHFAVRAVPVRDDDGAIREWVGADVDITGRKRVEAALQQSRDSLHLALSAAQMGSWHWNIVQDVFTWDAAHYAIFGIDPAQVTPSPELFWNMVHPGDRERLQSLSAIARQTGEPHQEEFRIVWPNGEVRWCTGGISVTLDDQGRAVSMSGLTTDITERKRAELNDRFLLDLDVQLREVADPDELLLSVASALGEHLTADRCYFARVDGDRCTVLRDWSRGLPSLSGTYAIADVISPAGWMALQRGEVVVVSEAATHGMASQYVERLRSFGMSAALTVPLLYRGDWVAMLEVGSSTAREWRVDEVALTQDVAKRIWPMVERGRAERALRESESQLQILANAMPQVVWVANADGVVRYYNDRVAAFAGVTRNPSGTWDWRQMIHADDLPSTLAAWRQAVQNQSPYVHEHRLLMANGSYRWHLSRAVPVIDPRGAVETWYGTATDIDEIKATELELERRRLEFAGLVEHSPDFVARIDRRYHYQYVNPAFEQLTGVSLDACLGQPVTTLGNTEQSAMLWQGRIDETFASGQEQLFEFTMPGREGSRFFRVRLVPETASDGSIETLLAIMYDVTDRVLAERERQALLNMLTHDLKSPLTALTLHAQSLRQLIARQGVPEAEALSARLSRFEDIAVQIAGLVDELSDLARLEARNRIDLQLVPVDLIDLARTCIDEARHSGASPAIQLETELNDLTVEGDLTRLRRVIANLLDNAVKYSPAHADITVRVLLEDGVAVVRVRDRGIGIPAADLPHIFNFRRRAGNVGDIAGSGVGLNGALRIVEQHGGTITVESSEGQGSTFTVRLPIG